MKKKIISIFAAAFILAAFCVPSVGFAALTLASPAIFDFEDQMPGTDVATGNGWTVTLGKGTHRVQYVKDPLDPENQVLDTYCGNGTTTGANTEVIYTYEDYITEKVVFDFNYMLDKKSGSDASFQLRGSKTSKFVVGAYNGSWQYKIGNNAAVTVPNKTAEINRWYHITVVLDPTEKKVQCWVDGEKIAEGSSSDSMNINNFYLYNRARNASTSKNVYFDNIRVRSYGSATNAEPIFNLRNSKKTIKLGETLEMDFTGRVIDTDGDSVTLTSDAGTIDGNVLRYTPDSSGTKTIHITADDGTEQSVYTMTVNVIETVELTVTGGAKEVEKGQQVTITATPDEGYAIASIKYDGLEVIGYTEGEKSYQTPELTKDTNVEVFFTPKKVPEAVTSAAGSAFNGTEDGVSFGTVFAAVSLSDTLMEYGVLFSETELAADAFVEEADGVFAAKAIVEANGKGQYGIKFTGDLKAGTYYTRAYAIYGGNTVYSDRIIPILIP